MVCICPEGQHIEHFTCRMDAVVATVANKGLFRRCIFIWRGGCAKRSGEGVVRILNGCQRKPDVRNSSLPALLGL